MDEFSTIFGGLIEAADMTLHGAVFRCSVLPEIGTEHMLLVLGPAIETTHAKVVHVGIDGFRVEFIDPSQGFLDALTRHVQRRAPAVICEVAVEAT